MYYFKLKQQIFVRFVRFSSILHNKKQFKLQKRIFKRFFSSKGALRTFFTFVPPQNISCPHFPPKKFRCWCHHWFWGFFMIRFLDCVQFNVYIVISYDWILNFWLCVFSLCVSSFLGERMSSFNLDTRMWLKTLELEEYGTLFLPYPYVEVRTHQLWWPICWFISQSPNTEVSQHFPLCWSSIKYIWHALMHRHCLGINL